MISGPGLDWAADLYISICHKDRKYFSLHSVICFSIFFLLTILKVETSSKCLKHSGWPKDWFFWFEIWGETTPDSFGDHLLVFIVAVLIRLLQVRDNAEHAAPEPDPLQAGQTV